jgi:hypothetical protein
MAFLIPDAPHATRRLTQREAVVVVSRKRDDYHTVEKRQLKWDQVWETFKDVKTYLYFMLGFCANLPNGATSNCKLAISNCELCEILTTFYSWYSCRERSRLYDVRDNIATDPLRHLHRPYDVGLKFACGFIVLVTLSKLCRHCG